MICCLRNIFSSVESISKNASNCGMLTDSRYPCVITSSNVKIKSKAFASTFDSSISTYKHSRQVNNHANLLLVRYFSCMLEQQLDWASSALRGPRWYLNFWLWWGQGIVSLLARKHTWSHLSPHECTVCLQKNALKWAHLCWLPDSISFGKLATYSSSLSLLMPTN